MRDYSSQKIEIETIKPRTITVNLSNADVKRLAEKSGEGGLTISELLENFIGDLVDGTYSNGSDERMYAEQWYQRCWFAMFSDDTFLKFLLLWGDLDDYIDLIKQFRRFLGEDPIQTSVVDVTALQLVEVTRKKVRRPLHECVRDKAEKSPERSEHVE